MSHISDSLSAQAGLMGQLLAELMEPHLAEAGISVATFELLSAVRSAGGRASQADIARRLGISPPSLSEAVKGALRRGLLERTPDPKDARAKRLALTTSGKQVVTKVVRRIEQAETKMIDGIAPAEVEAAIAVLRRANLNLARSMETMPL